MPARDDIYEESNFEGFPRMNPIMRNKGFNRNSFFFLGFDGHKYAEIKKTDENENDYFRERNFLFKEAIFFSFARLNIMIEHKEAGYISTG